MHKFESQGLLSRVKARTISSSAQPFQDLILPEPALVNSILIRGVEVIGFS